MQGSVKGICKSFIQITVDLQIYQHLYQATRFLSNPSSLQEETNLSDLRTASSSLYFPHLPPINLTFRSSMDLEYTFLMGK